MIRRSLFGKIVAVAGLWLCAISARAQCIEQWLPYPAALPGPVTAAVVDDPDGDGPLAGRIVLIAGGQLHQWDGTTLTRLSADVIGAFGGAGNGLAVYNGEIYVSGFFNSIGAVSARGIARFDGAVWRDVRSNVSTGFNLLVSSTALAVYGGELYFGGGFTSAGGAPSSHIIRWDGTQWRSLGGNAPVAGVQTLRVIGNELYVGGEFSGVPGVPGTTALAKWNGTQWLATNLPYGSLSYTTRIGSHDGVPWIHGVYYDSTNRVVVAQLVRKTAANWELVPGGGISGGPVAFAYAFAEYRGKMAVGGLFLNAGPLSGVNDIAFHNGGSTGTVWSRLLGGIGLTQFNHAVTQLVVYRDELHAFGNFTVVNGVPQNNWARWYEGPPIVTDQPDTAYLTLCDATKSFSVTAQGATTYQWRRNAAVIANGPTGNGGSFAGVTTATLTINNPSQFDAGAYDCVTTNVCGPRASEAAMLIACAVDFNCDGFVDFFDYDSYVLCFETGTCAPAASADFNGDGFIDFFDYDSFVEAFEAGC